MIRALSTRSGAGHDPASPAGNKRLVLALHPAVKRSPETSATLTHVYIQAGSTGRLYTTRSFGPRRRNLFRTCKAHCPCVHRSPLRGLTDRRFAFVVLNMSLHLKEQKDTRRCCNSDRTACSQTNIPSNIMKQFQVHVA